MPLEIYMNCPTYETNRFFVRLVRPEDAADLLACYADPQARRFFNSDNCDFGFAYDTLPEMEGCIFQWLAAYTNGDFVRFAIVNRQSGEAVGTIEMFHKTDLDEGGRRYGLLRIDLLFVLEREEVFSELLNLALQEFPAAFGVTHLLTKATPEAAWRVCALRAAGFLPVQESPKLIYRDYWVFG